MQSDAHSLTPGHPLLRLLIVGLGVVVMPLDSSVNVAFPYITAHFGLPVSDTKLIVVSFIVTSISLLLIAGRGGDVWGHRRVFQSGLLISAGALALVAWSPSFTTLLAARVLQGLGGALLVGSAPALAIGLYPESRRGAVIGAYGLMFAFGTATGPIIGGALADAFDWRAVFWYRVPIALAALALTPFLPAPPPRGETSANFDFTGAVFLGAGIAALFIALNLVWAGGLIWAGFAVIAGLGIALFVRRQAHISQPIIDLAYFRRPWFSGFTAASLGVNMASFSVMLLAPFYLNRIAGMGAGAAGLILASYPAGLAAAALTTGRVLARIDRAVAGAASARAARLLVFAPLITGAGLWLIGGWNEATGAGFMLAAMALTGLGIGIFQAAYFFIVTGEIPAANRGVAGSLAEMTRSSGYLFAATLLFELFRATSGAAGFLAGFQTTLHWAAAISASVFVLALFAARSQRVGANTEPSG
jgi:MFS family permease